MGHIFKMVAYPQLSEICRQHYEKGSKFEVLLGIIKGVSDSQEIEPLTFCTTWKQIVDIVQEGTAIKTIYDNNKGQYNYIADANVIPFSKVQVIIRTVYNVQQGFIQRY